MSLKATLGEMLAPVFRKRRYLLLCKDLAMDSSRVSSGRLEVAPIRPEHRDKLEQFIREHHRDVARSLRMVDACLQNRYEGHMALLNGQVIGYRWWVTHTMSHPQLALYGLTLRENEIYAFALYIARAFRGQGYAKEFLAITEKLLLEQGYKRIYNSVDIYNMPARRVHEAFGSKEIGFHGYLCFFSLVVFSHGRWLRYNPVWM